MVEKKATEVGSLPTPPSDEPVAEPAESRPVELVHPVAEGPFPKESEPTPTEPVIANLDAAKEVESHAAELEIAPEPMQTVISVLGFARCGFICG